jgi:DNA-binding LacI/PurR family transcriptional regulator
LVQLGFTPVLCTRTAGGLTEAEYVTMLLDQQVSGVVFCGGLSSDEYRQLLGRGVPVVLLNAAVDFAGAHRDGPPAPAAGHRVGFPQVSTDDTAAVQQAFAHLTSLGHQRIGLLVGPADHTPSQRKSAAFKALTGRSGGAGGVGDFRIGHALFSFEGGQAVASELWGAGMTGLICGSDVIALGAIRAARRLGLSVPGEVSVVGYDDSAFMNYTDPPLTTLRQPIEAMARAAVTLLVNQISGNSPTPKELLHEPELVVRGSTGPLNAPRLVREAEELARGALAAAASRAS